METKQCELLIQKVYVPPVKKKEVKPVYCLRCTEITMVYIGEQKLQRGSTFSNVFFPDLGPIFQGQLKVEVYKCPSCYRLEFFSYEPIHAETDH